MKLSVVVNETGLNIRRSAGAGLVNTMIMALALLMLGTFGLISYNIVLAINTVRQKVDMEVYLKDGYPETRLMQVKTAIEGLAGVQVVTYISKEQAVNEGRVDAKYLAVLMDNPLPASFRITFQADFRTASHVQQLAEQITQYPEVEDIVYGKEWIAALDKITQTFLVLAGLTGLVLVLVSYFMVANTVRLTYLRRQDDMEVLYLIGATRRMIKAPFVLEGLLQGIVAGVSAALVIQGGTLLVNAYLFLPLALPQLKFLSLIVLAGAALGYVGSSFSIRSYVH